MLTFEQLDAIKSQAGQHTPDQALVGVSAGQLEASLQLAVALEDGRRAIWLAHLGLEIVQDRLLPAHLLEWFQHGFVEALLAEVQRLREENAQLQRQNDETQSALDEWANGVLGALKALFPFTS